MTVSKLDCLLNLDGGWHSVYPCFGIESHDAEVSVSKFDELSLLDFALLSKLE